MRGGEGSGVRLAGILKSWKCVSRVSASCFGPFRCGPLFSGPELPRGRGLIRPHDPSRKGWHKIPQADHLPEDHDFPSPGSIPCEHSLPHPSIRGGC